MHPVDEIIMKSQHCMQEYSYDEYCRIMRIYDKAMLEQKTVVAKLYLRIARDYAYLSYYFSGNDIDSERAHNNTVYVISRIYKDIDTLCAHS